MKQNMGTIDRLIRIIATLVLAVLFFTHFTGGVTGIIALAMACILLLTAVVGNCPLYSLFGIKTCASKKIHNI